MRRSLPSAGFAIGALAVGLALGVLAHDSHAPAVVTAASLLDAIGKVWLDALLMVSLPLVISLLTVTVIGTGRDQLGAGLGRSTMTWFVIILTVAVIASVLFAFALVHWLPASAAARAAMRASIATTSGRVATGAPSWTEWVDHLVPANLFKALGDGDLLPIILAVLAFAAAARTIKPEQRALLRRGFEASAETCLSLTQLILRLLPVAVFALTFSAGVHAGPLVVSGVGYFVVALIVLLLIGILLLYPLTWWRGGATPARFGRAIWPCQLVAAGTRSSLAALPSMLDRGEHDLGLAEPVATFVLPLAVSVFKPDCALSTPIKAIVLAHLYGTPLSPGAVLMFAAMAFLTSFGTPGIPSGGTIVSLPFFAAAGIPLEGVVLLNAVDAIPDLFKTVLNVTANLSVATISGRASGFALKADRRALREPGHHARALA